MDALSGQDAYMSIRNQYYDEVSRFKEMSDAAREGLTNVFTFVENAFGDGQEMLVLVTELTARYYCSRFISDYGCDKYFEHNSDLLIYQRENDLKARIEQLGITQEQ